ncbi:MAG: hypothetical protein J7L83_00150 [Thaumarchaeota archaeon]|nr:hypothetical protein [Nitrososphaerota archaeon]
MEGGKDSEENRVIIELKYLETPVGKVPTLEFAKSLLKAIQILDDATANIEEKLGKLEEGGLMPKNLEEVQERLNSMESAIKDIQKKLDLEVGEILDKLSALTDAFSELVERVQRIEESLPKD